MEKKSAPHILLGRLVVAHFSLIAIHFEPAYASPDAHGYYYQAKLIAEKGKTSFDAESSLRAIGAHWLVTEDDRFFSRYPPGFSLLLALVYKIGGPIAALWVNPVLSSLAILLMFFICRPWLGNWYGLGAAALLALNPMFNGRALNADSHTLTMFLVMGGFLLLQMWASKGWLVAAFFSGLLFGFIPVVRYPEALVGIGVIAFLVSYYKNEGTPALIGIGLSVVGALIPILGLLIRNQLAFGAFWRTGYSLTDEQTGFGFSYFQSNAVNYMEQLMSSGWGVMFVPGILGMVWLFFRKYTRHHAYLLVGAALPLTLAYMAYYWAGGINGAGGLRFFLPLLPLIIFAGTWFVSRINKTMPTPAWLLMSALVLMQLAIGLPSSIAQLGRSEATIKRNAVAFEEIEKIVPEGSVVLMGRQLTAWLDYAGNWKLADETLVSGRGGPGGGRFSGGGPGSDQSGPSPLQREKLEASRARYTGLPGQERIQLIRSDLEEWAGSSDVFWVGSDRIVERFLRNSQNDSFSWESVGELELPDIPRLDSNRRGQDVDGSSGPLTRRGGGAGGFGDSPIVQRLREARAGGGFFGGVESKLKIYRWNRSSSVSNN